MPKSAPKMPDNVEPFLKETKDRLHTLDAEGWCIELTELYDLSVTYNLGLHTPDPRTQTYAELSETDERERELIVQSSVPTLQLMEASGDELRLPPERQPSWIIDANAPEAAILEQIKLALEERRKSNPPPVAKRGRHAPNNSIDIATFAKWRSSKIVELGRLLAWRARLDPKEAKRYPDHVLGQWLGFGGKDGAGAVAKKTDAAKRTLKQALANRPALLAQVGQEAASTATTGDAAMPWFLKHMKIRLDTDGNPEILIPKQVIVAKTIDTRKRRP
jgi:hypothetical protein